MTFNDKLKAAGFSSRREFASHVKKHYNTVYNWGDEPPHWVGLYLGLRIKIREVVGE